MNPDPDKQDELQKMLALKRHETPSPRFFKGFSGQVIDRLHAPEPPVVQAWWQRLGLDRKPVQITITGVAVCGLIVVGLIASLSVDPPKPAPPSPDDQTHLVVAPSPNAVPASSGNPLSGVAEMPRISDPVVVSRPAPIGQRAPKPNQAVITPAAPRNKNSVTNRN
jgi:hypothetical protein